jgi:hypothetical protein
MSAPSGDGCLDHLHTLLAYDPGSGEFRWREKVSSRRPAGSPAGTRTARGYIRIRINGKTHAAHRLAWLFVYGDWPEQQIDHINGDRADNRIANLRDVAPRVNSQNRKRANATNSNGLLGVSRCRERGTFVAQIRDPQGRMKFLGRFDQSEAAHAAYLKAKAVLHEGNTL